MSYLFYFPYFNIRGELFRKDSIIDDNDNDIDIGAIELSASQRPKYIFDGLDGNYAIANQSAINCSGPRCEVESYLTELTMKHENSFQYWKAPQDQYRRLNISARKELCIIVNSVPCEHIFSKMNHL